jgi:hypothetical protein
MHPETGPCIMQGDRTLHHAASDGLFVSVCVCVWGGGVVRIQALWQLWQQS